MGSPVRQSILSEIAATAARKPGKLNQLYLEHMREIGEATGRPALMTADIAVDPKGGYLDALRVSMVANDITFIGVEHVNEGILLPIAPEEVEKYTGSSEVAINLPEGLPDYFAKNIKNKPLGLAFYTPTGKQVQKFFEQISPLIESGRIIPRPDRRVLYLASEDPDGRRTWDALVIPQGTPLNVWHMGWEGSGAPIEIVSGDAASGDERVLFDAVVPFLSNVPLATLAKILDDEGDAVLEYRAALKKTVRESRKNGMDARTIAADVLGPKVSKLERRFATLRRLSALKIGGAVLTTATLSLTSYVQSGVAASITAALGAGGAALVVKEFASHVSDMAGLKDDDAYLLWKLRRAAR